MPKIQIPRETVRSQIVVGANKCDRAVGRHYGTGELAHRIRQALQNAHTDTRPPNTAELVPIDQFHLSASNDAILPLFGFGLRPFPDLERMFVKHPDHAVTQIISGTELKDIWTQLDVALWEESQKLSSSDWLQRNQGVSPEDFVREPHRNRYASRLGRTAHLAYHLGQAILTQRDSNRL